MPIVLLQSAATPSSVLGDRGYLSSTQQLDLFETANIVLETPMRINQKGYKK